MRYRGFNITTCVDHGIERYDYREQITKSCDGFYCEIYPGNDDQYANRLDYFCLAEGFEIPDCSDHSLEIGIMNFIDYNISSLREALLDMVSNRNADLLGKTVCILRELQSDEELYHTLSKDIGMSDDEIRMIGFKSLAPHFNRSGYAQTIAEYLTDKGTELTHTGNYHFDFEEINGHFGTSFPQDKDLLQKVIDALCPDIVSDIETSDDFDLMFYLDYCPNYEGEDEEQDDTPIQQM